MTTYYMSRVDYARAVVVEGRKEHLLEDEEWAALVRQFTGCKRPEARWMMKEAVELFTHYEQQTPPWLAVRRIASACNWPRERDA